MFFKVLAVAGWVAVSCISSASAQTLAGPAETPPSSFKGSQYVDSRGCVYLRAGIGGRVTWVPRISRDRKAICGQSSASAAREVAAAAAKPAPAPRAPQQSSGFSGKPMETIASLAHAKPRVQAPRLLSKPVMQPAVTALAPVAAASRGTAPAVRLQKGCPAASPYGARVKFTDGRRSLICSTDPGFDVRAAAIRSQVARNTPAPITRPAPQYHTKADSAGVFASGGYKCPASAPVARRFAIRGGGSTVLCITAGGGLASATPPLGLGKQAAFAVPRGYKNAWNDGRLNPRRGKGTAVGQAQQDLVWTRDVPARLIEKGAAKQASGQKLYTTSTSNAAAGRYYVQIGTFGESANAMATAARLRGLGLPVAKSRITSKGRKLQIVMAGPFDNAGSAQAALSAAKRSGFADAFIR